MPGELRIWGDVRENGKDELVWEFATEKTERGRLTVNILLKKTDARARTKASLGCGRSEGLR